MDIYDIVLGNINNMLKAKKIKNKDLAEKLDMSVPYINAILTKTKNDGIKISLIEKIAKILNTKTEDLFSLTTQNSNYEKNILLYDTYVSAGSGELIEDADTSFIKINEKLLPKISDKDLFAVKVKGDSMQPTLKDNDLIIVEDLRNKDFLFKPGIYILEDNYNGSKVKRLRKDIYGNLIIQSDNPNYAEEKILVQDLDNIRIIGNVISSFSSFM